MKKKYLLSLLILLMAVTGSFANGNTGRIPKQVSSQFVNDFAPMGNVTWEKIDFYYKANFDQQGMAISAFYTGSGEFMGFGNHTTIAHLPMGLQNDIKTNFRGYWITDLITYTDDENTGYVITLENADQRITLRALDNGHWTLDKRQAKS